MEARAKNPFHYAVPGGESPEEVAKRVIEAVDEIAQRHLNQSVLIVAHGVSLAVIYCRAKGIPLEQVYENIPENAKPYHVKWG